MDKSYTAAEYEIILKLIDCWNENIHILMKFSLLAAPGFVILKIFCAATEEMSPKWLYFDNFQHSQWCQFCENYNIYVSVTFC